MANSKISALTSATTPLAGTETLPIVQSSTTKQVSVSNLTAGRSVSAASLSLTTTPLAVGSGGTGTATAFTDGSIVFASAAGVYSQNNSNFFWDNTNNRLGIGTASPAVKLSLDSGASAEYMRLNSTNASGGYSRYLNSGSTIGYIGSGAQVSGAASTDFGFTANANLILSYGGGTEGARLDTSANFNIKLGNVVQGTAAKGFNFTANTPASGMTSQLLNWYEEGTWTPAITFGGGSTGITYSSRDGYYTRTGNIVTCTAYIALSNKGSSTGAASVAGLPFTIKNNSGAYSPATLRLQNITFSNQFQGYATVGTTTVSLEQVLVTGTTSSLTDSNFANNSAVMICIIYRAA